MYTEKHLNVFEISFAKLFSFRNIFFGQKSIYMDCGGWNNTQNVSTILKYSGMSPDSIFLKSDVFW